MLNTQRNTPEAPRGQGSLMSGLTASGKARIMALAAAVGLSATACVNPGTVSGGNASEAGSLDGGSLGPDGGYAPFDAGRAPQDLGFFQGIDTQQPAVDTAVAADTATVDTAAAADSNKGKFIPTSNANCPPNPNIGSKRKSPDPTDPNGECTIVYDANCQIKCVGSGN